MNRIIFGFFILTLLGCSAGKLNNTLRQEINDVAVISQIGPSFYVDTIGTTIFQNKELTFDVSAWKINDQIQEMFRKNLTARNKNLVSVALDESAIHAAMLKQKEAGKPLFGFTEEALRDLSFDAAAKAGAKYLFLIVSLERHDGYPLYRGPMGMICYDRKLRNTKASPYFLYQASFWNVASKKKIFQTTINPTITENIDPINCSALKGIKEQVAVRDLKANVSDALERTVQSIFTKMDW